MPIWWKKKVPLVGSVLFRGSLPLRPEDFSLLQNKGIRITPTRNNTRTSWSLKLNHKEWGEAELVVNDTIPLISKNFYEYSLMAESDRKAAVAAGNRVFLEMNARHEYVLGDRKLLLRFLHAIMGNDGIVAVDHLSWRVWAREDHRSW